MIGKYGCLIKMFGENSFRTFLRKLLFKIIRWSGLPYLFREIIQKNKVTILMFHELEKEFAKSAFEYLSNNYNIIHLNTLIKAIEENNSEIIPNKALIITFDDGHISNYELLPMFKKHNIPVTIFLTAAIINTNRHFWWKYHKIRRKKKMQERLKRCSNEERLKYLLEIGYNNLTKFENPQALQKQQISEMCNSVNMQSHTLYHPILTKCTTEKAKREIFKSKMILENDYGLQINAIAYPNGDYTEREVSFVKKADYRCALTVDYGFNTIYTNIYKLKRISGGSGTDLTELIVKASGVWAFIKTLNGLRRYR